MKQTVALALADFLLARIGEDEALAKQAQQEHWAWRMQSGIVVADRRTFPARVRTECEAKRQIVRNAKAWVITPGDVIQATAEALTRVLQYLALPYADHPDYREEWAV